MEPEWEARFERHSYGFRPGRGCHDAIEAIFGVIKQKPKYVLDADIAQCFDHISHQALLNKLTTYPALRQTIRAWLKAGVMDAGTFTSTEEGTPQGGVISPLLANIALHGMEAAIRNAYTVREGKPTLIRYADDFVILHSTHAGIEKAKDVIEPWLQTIGLELKPSKTRIAHTLYPLQGEPGFDFLGMTIRQYPVGPAHSGRDTYGRLLGFKTLIKPSEDAIKRHVRALGRVVRKHQTAPQAALIEHLNPVIRGWATYYRTVVAKDSYARCDDWLYSKLRYWARRRHRNKSLRWSSKKYWTIGAADGWTFKAPDGSVLTRHTATPIKRHVKVQGTASPYDGNLIYWAQRLTDHPLTRSTLAHLLRRQRGRCASCGLYVKEGDVLEIDHIIPRVAQDDNRMINLHVLHRHCHDRKTAQDGSNQASVSRGIHVTDHLLEEPDEVNVSCPVL